MIPHFTLHYDISKLRYRSQYRWRSGGAPATKESLENLIASVYHFFDKTFTTGDLVKAQGLYRQC